MKQIVAPNARVTIGGLQGLVPGLNKANANNDVKSGTELVGRGTYLVKKLISQLPPDHLRPIFEDIQKEANDIMRKLLSDRGNMNDIRRFLIKITNTLQGGLRGTVTGVSHNLQHF